MFKAIFLLAVVFSTPGLVRERQEPCGSAGSYSDSAPKRLVIIKGKAMIMNFPGVGKLPATSETIIFQKVGCESCFIGTDVDIEGNYRIRVGDGKYKVIVRNPSSPDVDLLAPGQERFIDTCENSLRQVFYFDVQIKLPK